VQSAVCSQQSAVCRLQGPDPNLRRIPRDSQAETEAETKIETKIEIELEIEIEIEIKMEYREGGECTS
jgi:hypothetical protein